MICGIQAAGTIELYFYDELPPVERLRVRSHLSTCAECRQTLDDLSVIRAALASLPDVAAPPGGDWSGFTARLERAAHGSSHGGSRPVRIVPYLAMAALLVLVTIAVLTVARARPEPAPASASADRPAAVERMNGAPASPDRALLSLSDQHFERSKLVVLGLTTRDAAASGQEDWVYERDLAMTLLRDTRLYRQAAEERGMNSLADVMQDLELVLLQTSMSRESDAGSLEHLQRLIRRRDLLTKMNLVYAGGS